MIRLKLNLKTSKVESWVLDIFVRGSPRGCMWDATHIYIITLGVQVLSSPTCIAGISRTFDLVCEKVRESLCFDSNDDRIMRAIDVLLDCR
jgi:hypothetical protein